MPCNEPSSHPATMLASSRDTATALIGDLGFLSLGHLQAQHGERMVLYLGRCVGPSVLRHEVAHGNIQYLKRSQSLRSNILPTVRMG